MKKKNRPTSLLTLLLLVSLASCGSSTYDDRDVFNWNIHAGITSLDPAFARNQANIWGVHQMFNGLLELDDDLKPVPAIAHSWEVSDDGKTYTFYLRDDVYFHDHELFTGGEGRKVTADDFVYSFNRILDPDIASPGAWIFHGVVKIEEHDDGLRTGAFFADDDTTFRIELERPFPPMTGLMTMHYCSVVPREIADHYGREFRDNPVGTGPFKLAFWEEDTRLILHRNPNYFESENGNQLPYLDAVNISFTSGKQSEFFSFVRGDLDFMSGTDPSFQDNLLTRDGKLTQLFDGEFRMEKNPFLNSEYLGILVDTTLEIVQNSPLRYKKVRQAINYGFDRKRMITYLNSNIGRPATDGFVPYGMAGYDHDRIKGYDYNPDKSVQLLKEAGFPNGKGMPEIRLNTTEDYLDYAVYIQNHVEDLGINIRIDVNPPSMHRELMSRSDANFFRGSWIADYPEPENYLALYYSDHFTPGGPNYTRFSHPEFDRLYEKALSETHDSIRYELYYEMENLMMEESPVVVLYYDEVVRLIHHHVKGLNRNAINLICLKRVHFER